MPAGGPAPRGKEVAIAGGIACLLIFAPLFRGGNRPLPLMVLGLGGLALLLGWYGAGRRPFATSTVLPAL